MRAYLPACNRHWDNRVAVASAQHGCDWQVQCAAPSRDFDLSTFSRGIILSRLKSQVRISATSSMFVRQYDLQPKACSPRPKTSHDSQREQSNISTPLKLSNAHDHSTRIRLADIRLSTSTARNSAKRRRELRPASLVFMVFRCRVEDSDVDSTTVHSGATSSSTKANC